MKKKEIGRLLSRLKVSKPLTPLSGYWSKHTVMLDLDRMKLRTVKYWAFRTLRFFKLEGFIILRSSKGNYQAVFNRTVSWTKNLHVVAWVALLSHSKPLQKWFTMQAIKETACLRTGRKRRKKPPQIIFHYGFQDCEIRYYLIYRKLGEKTAAS
jgi:hypothetical protein